MLEAIVYNIRVDKLARGMNKKVEAISQINCTSANKVY